MATRLYNVVVTRLQPQSVSFEVEASSEEEARELALNTCGVEVFEACDETVESCEECVGPLTKLTRQQLVDLVIEEIKRDVANGDLTAVEELLGFVPPDNLRGYLPDL